MTPLQTIKVVLVVLILSAGQILFKLAASQIRPGSPRDLLISLILSPQLIAALAIYGLATILWVLVLREVPLSRAYPVTALGMVLVPALSLFLFHEPFSWSLLLGGALLIAGIYVIALC
jgi:undecaprenyl phosphate-alpha-L-ara4N flippase subunit ArnE